MEKDFFSYKGAERTIIYIYIYKLRRRLLGLNWAKMEVSNVGKAHLCHF